jgi:hypothetical protein
VNSLTTFLKNLPLKDGIDRTKMHHYFLRTYDVAFNIIAADYELKLK